MNKYPTPTIFLTSEEDSKLYKTCRELSMTRTEFIYQAIIEKIDDHDRDNKNNTGT